MTIDECLEFADEWVRGMTYHEGSQGWRVVCMLLAEEVRKMRSEGEAVQMAYMEEVQDTLKEMGAVVVAAKNLIAQKGRHNTQIAYERLEASLKTPNV